MLHWIWNRIISGWDYNTPYSYEEGQYVRHFNFSRLWIWKAMLLSSKSVREPLSNFEQAAPIYSCFTPTESGQQPESWQKWKSLSQVFIKHYYLRKKHTLKPKISLVDTMGSYGNVVGFCLDFELSFVYQKAIRKMIKTFARN